MNQTNIPESELFKAIREATMVGASVSFSESDALFQPSYEVRISRKTKSQKQTLTRHVGYEIEAVLAIREFIHEAT